MSSSVRELLAKKGRKSKTDMAIIEAEKQRLQQKIASMPAPLPTPDLDRKNIIMFAALGSTYNAKGYDNWTQQDFDTVGKRLDDANGRIQSILTEWDELALKIIEEEDPLLNFATESEVERGVRYKRDAILSESPIYTWKQASQARNRYLKNQERIRRGLKPLPVEHKEEVLCVTYVSSADIPIEQHSDVMNYEYSKLRNPMSIAGLRRLEQEYRSFNGTLIRETMYDVNTNTQYSSSRPLGGEQTGLPF